MQSRRPGNIVPTRNAISNPNLRNSTRTTANQMTLSNHNKPSSRSSSPLKTADSRVTSPMKASAQKRDVMRMPSPRKTPVSAVVDTGLKKGRQVEPPVKKKQVAPSAYKTSGVGTNEMVNGNSNGVVEEVRPVMQRSTTFLKDEPTVLGKMWTNRVS